MWETSGQFCGQGGSGDDRHRADPSPSFPSHCMEAKTVLKSCEGELLSLRAASGPHVWRGMRGMPQRLCQQFV